MLPVFTITLAWFRPSLLWLRPAAFAASLAPAPGQEAELSGARAMALYEATRDPTVPATAHAASRTVRIERKAGRLFVHARWRLRASKASWLADVLIRGDVLVRTVTIDGRPAAIAADAHATYIAAWIDGPADLELVAELRSDPARGPVPITLLAAIRGTAIVDGEPTWRVESAAVSGSDYETGASAGDAVIHVGGITHGGAAALQLALRTPPPADTSIVAIGRIGVGLFVGDAEMRGRARLQWVLRRGELARVTFTARGVGEDFTVTGPDVREVKREGEIVQVELQAAVSSAVALEAAWSQKTPPGDATVTPPSFELAGTSRTEASFELGRDGDIDVLPALTGWRQVAAQELPTWGRDLIEGTAAAAWTRHAPAEPGRLSLLRFVPVEAPKVVIGEASFELASADHGATLIKARYEVLNERASHLRVTLPPRSRLLAVEVAGTDARTAEDGDQILVPIPRSLETLQGLVAIPVVVSMLVDQPRWRRREHRTLPLPSVDAPIRSIAARWLLPRDAHATSDVGDDGIADIDRADPPQPAVKHKRARKRSKKSGMTLYDFADDESAASAMTPESPAPVVSDDMKQSESDRLLREAQESYNRNEFDDAQDRIDELRERGLDEDGYADKLQSNLDIVNAPTGSSTSTEGGEDVAMPAARDYSAIAGKAGVVRRIKDQARARGQKKMLENQVRKRNAKELRSKGDYKAAEAEYRRVIEESKKAGNLEQDESAAMDYETEAVEKELEATKTEAAARESIDAQAKTKFMAPLDERGEFGLGSAETTFSAALDTIDEPQPQTTPAPNHGPRVLMPARGGDLVIYSFDLWAPGSHHTLVVDAKRRRHRF